MTLTKQVSELSPGAIRVLATRTIKRVCGDRTVDCWRDLFDRAYAVALNGGPVTLDLLAELVEQREELKASVLQAIVGYTPKYNLAMLDCVLSALRAMGTSDWTMAVDMLEAARKLAGRVAYGSFEGAYSLEADKQVADLTELKGR